MKIVFDISILGMSQYNSVYRTGIFRVVENIAYGLAASKECKLTFCVSPPFSPIQTLYSSLDYLESNPRIRRVPLPHSRLKRIFDSQVADLNTKITKASKLQRLLLKTIRKPVYYTARAMEAYYHQIDPKSLAEADIFHASHFAIPEEAKKLKNVKKFLTVYDLTPISYPQFYEFNENDGHFLKKVLESLDQDDWAICISQATKNDLCNYLKIDPSRVFVTHLAAEPELFSVCSDSERISLTRKKYHIPDAPYILSVNTLQPRKNLAHVIRCFAKLVQQENIKDLSLVLVGAKGWKYSNLLEVISDYDFLKERIILTGYVADEDLAGLYSGALAFVYPSFYEGFGLPPLEAMQCGVPVITSNTSSLPEVVGNAGIMVAPTDVDALCQSMLEIYSKPYLREALSLKSIERAKQFSWDKCTQELISAYKTSLSS